MDDIQFALGLTFEAYLDKMTDARREGFQNSYQLAQISEEDRQALALAVGATIYVVAFSEDWCGDCRINLPVMARLSEVVNGLLLRCFSREANPNLATALRIERIPTLVFFNQQWQEIGRFVERPATVAKVMQDGDAEEKRLARIAYNQGRFHADTVEEIIDLLHN